MVATSNRQLILRKPKNRDFFKQYVEDILFENKSYLKQGFSLKDFSKETGINLPTLSALINKEYGMNFNDFINQQRVEYFKYLLSLPKFMQWTLEATAMKAGFSSRTTFIRAFTKFEECSPSDYLKAVRINPESN
jgi:AraC-like DNA-binding protein